MSPEPLWVLHYASTVCAATFLARLPARFWELHNSNIKSSRNWQGLLKAAIGTLLSMRLAAYWVQNVALEIQFKTTFLVSLSASAFAALGLSLLLLQENQRSRKSSDSATLYLLSSLLCDAVYLTVPSKTSVRMNTSQPTIFRFYMHLLLLAFECCAKRSAAGALSSNMSPEDVYCVISRVMFTWINPILVRGYRNILLSQSLPALHQDMDPGLTRETILRVWSQQSEPKPKHALLSALIKCLRKPILGAVPARLFLILFRYSQPALIESSIKHVTAPSTDESNRGYWLIVSAVVIYIGLALSTSIYQHRLNRLKLMTRSALIGLIHDQTMKLPSLACDNSQAIILMSTDADGLDGIAEILHETWAQVVEVVIGMGMLASQVGWIWLVLIFLIYLCSHMSRFVAKHLQPCQKAWNNATQDRLAATSSLLNAIKVVKMLGFQHNLTRRIQELRREELWVASKLRWIMVYYNASANALGIFSPAITLVIFAVVSVARGGSLDTQTAFTTMAILSMVTHPANMVMTIVPRAVAAFSGFERIQAFLLRQPLRATRRILPSVELNWDTRAFNDRTERGTAIQISQLRIGCGPVILENVNIKLPAGSFTIISGSSGSGKSMLLRAILGEVPAVDGTVGLSTRRIAYCAQTPWLPNGTIKDIIYGATNPFDITGQDDDTWYRAVINACCLTHDFESLLDGDQTKLGSRGINLSGGQRQRVTLARALFARCEILLLDDPFSALDGATEQTIFKNLFGQTGLIRHSQPTVVLVCNSPQYFRAADHIVILENHTIMCQGSWQTVSVKGSRVSKFSTSQHTEDYAILSADFEKLDTQLRLKDEIELDLTRRSGDRTLYGYYLSFVDRINLLLLLSSAMIYAFTITFPQYWLQIWTHSSAGYSGFYIGGFLVLSTMSWASTSAMMWSIVTRIAPQSGLRLHQRLLHIVTSAHLTFFFITDNGSILNRFSQDIQIIDKQLPLALQTVITQVFKLLMQTIFLCIVEKWLIMSLPACTVVIYIVQMFYLRTSRQLRFLELESRAGVFSSFLESVEGLETIRSFDWCHAAIRKNILSVDDSQRPEFLLLCLQRWLNIVLDLLAAAIAIGVVAIAVAFKGRVGGAQVGIALNIMLVVNTTLLKLLESWTTLENSLGAIYRLRSLETTTLLEDERAWKWEPATDWPSSGHLRIKDITASYHSGTCALRNVSLEITPGQKVIICGRTGSGKSTLLLTLFRLLEVQSGMIELDGIDIKQDSLLLHNDTLRFNLDPDNLVSDDVIIDALSKTSLSSHFALGKVHSQENTATLQTLGPGCAKNLILDRKITDFLELSVGQRQLFALCRALVKVRSLRHQGVKPIIVLDEVTSSLDTNTESTIHRVINEEFCEQSHTVIIVTHRLVALMKHMKVGRDFVVLMADGKVQDTIKDLSSATLQALKHAE